jgi:hypothetical protein
MLGQCARCNKTVNHSKTGNAFRHKSPETGEWCAPQVSDPTPTVDAMDDTKGPWFDASYDGECSRGDHLIEPGDRIRADGSGGYECNEECVSDAVPHTVAEARAAGWEVIQLDPPNSVETVGGGTLLLPPGIEPTSLTAPEARWNFVPDPAAITPDAFMDPAAEDTDELNVSGQPKARYQWRGSQNMGYLVVDPDQGDFRRYKNGSPKGLTRATTFNKAASSTTSLTGWKQRNVVIGASRRPDLLVKAHGLDHSTGRKVLDELVAEFEETAGAKVGADIGTYLHEYTERMDAGLATWQDAPPQYREQLRRYKQMLDYAGFEAVPGLIERTTMIREFGGIVGTLDRVLYHRPSGQYVIGDLKTGKTMDYARDETFCQEWIYAHGVNQNGVYDWNTDTWEEPWDDHEERDQRPIKVSETVGLIIHMPVQGDDAGSVFLEEADLAKGARYAQLCHDVRSNVKPKRKLWSWEPEEAPQEPAWELKFAQVTSQAQASELWLEAKAAGVNGIRLNDLVQIARIALTGNG